MTASTTLLPDFTTLVRTRFRATGNAIRVAFRVNRFRVGMGVSLAALLWFGLFYFFYRGFEFVNSIDLADLRPILLRHLFGLFFMTLLVLLLFSNSIIAYMGLFR